MALESAMLPEILDALTHKTFHEVGELYGVSHQGVRNFLTRSGVNPHDYSKLDRAHETTPEQFQNLGPAIYAIPFRAITLRGWPLHTDFTPDEMEVKD